MTKGFTMVVDWYCEEKDAPKIAGLLTSFVKQTIANYPDASIENIDDNTDELNNER